MKNFGLFLILLFISVLSQAQIKCSAIANASLETRVEYWNDVKVVVNTGTLFGKVIDVRRVDRTQLHNGMFMGEELGGDDAFFIGLNSGGHMYLVANVYRYDGKVAFERSTIREKSSWLDKGIVLRVEDPDGKIQDQIIDYFKKNGAPRSVNCAAGVCKVLSESSELQVARGIRQTVIPSALIRNIVLNGIKGPQGQRKEAQLFVIGNADPKTVIDASDRLVQRYYRTLKPYAVTAGVASLGLISTLISWFL